IWRTYWEGMVPDKARWAQCGLERPLDEVAPLVDRDRFRFQLSPPPKGCSRRSCRRGFAREASWTGRSRRYAAAYSAATGAAVLAWRRSISKAVSMTSPKMA